MNPELQLPSTPVHEFSPVTVRRAVAASAAVFDVDSTAILSAIRSRAVVSARHCAWRILTTHTFLSSTEIGLRFSVHYSSVINGLAVQRQRVLDDSLYCRLCSIAEHIARLDPSATAETASTDETP